MNHTAELVMEKHHDPVGARIGMWLFLFTELLLFGGLFLLYAIYLHNHPEDFRYGSSHLDQFVGALNTIILLTSSLTMVLAVATLQRRKEKLATLFLILTLLLGAFFLVNKYFEWSVKIAHGLYPGSEELLSRPYGEVLFYGLYYVMTGLHALHVVIGLIAMLFLLRFVIRKRQRVQVLPPSVLPEYQGKRLQLSDEQGRKIWESEPLGKEVRAVAIVVDGVRTEDDWKANVIKFENTGLYWHLVDIIWIFLFPLFYLIAM